MAHQSDLIFMTSKSSKKWKIRVLESIERSCQCLNVACMGIKTTTLTRLTLLTHNLGI